MKKSILLLPAFLMFSTPEILFANEDASEVMIYSQEQAENLDLEGLQAADELPLDTSHTMNIESANESDLSLQNCPPGMRCPPQGGGRYNPPNRGPQQPPRHGGPGYTPPHNPSYPPRYNPPYRPGPPNYPMPPRRPVPPPYYPAPPYRPAPPVFPPPGGPLVTCFVENQVGMVFQASGYSAPRMVEEIAMNACWRDYSSLDCRPVGCRY